MSYTDDPRVIAILTKYVDVSSWRNTDVARELQQDLYHYTGMSGEDLQQLALLLQELKPDNLQDQQNCAPTFEEFVALSRQYPSLTFHGYVVTKVRSDERITIEGYEGGVAYNNAAALYDMHGDSVGDWSEEDEGDGSVYVYAWWD